MKNKELTEMTLEELWQLFPIILVKHCKQWKDWYKEENEYLSTHLTHVASIKHIGSTAINNICAKPIIDILVELPNKEELYKAKDVLVKKATYACLKVKTKYRLIKVIPKVDLPKKFFIYICDYRMIRMKYCLRTF